MTLSITPEATSVTPNASKHEALAMCAYRFENEAGGNLLRRALLAEILTDQYGMSPEMAIDEAMYGCTSLVREAGQEKDRLIEQARRAALAADMDGQVA